MFGRLEDFRRIATRYDERAGPRPSTTLNLVDQLSPGPGASVYALSRALFPAPKRTTPRHRRQVSGDRPAGRVQQRSERDLSAQGDLLEILADLNRARRVAPIHIDIAEL